MHTGLEIGFALDRRWHFLRGEMESSKRPALVTVARALTDAGVPYAIIGGIAVQVHTQEPRTTLDIDIAVHRRDSLPAQAFLAQGLVPSGEHPHSSNWQSADGTPIQFTDDPALGPAIARAIEVPLDSITLHVLAKPDLLREKLRAGGDPAWRRSKRLHDLADAERLLEEDATLEALLTAQERLLLSR